MRSLVSDPSRVTPRLLREDAVPVPLVTGGERPYINLDIAASAPPLAAVAEAVDAFLPWYSSVHRGAGFLSQVATAAYDGARASVARFVGARPDDVVVFTRNTTDSMNVLAHALPDDATVVMFESEHHANLLPWRRRATVVLPTPPTRRDAVASLDAVLATQSGTVLVAITGASNVTGELWPIEDLCATARRHGARIVLDAAQLAPHAPVDLGSYDVDWVAFSGHKMYAPYGVGALVGRRDWLEQGPPMIAGGGAVLFVTPDEVDWLGAPDRQEAGSPNVVGAVALGAACDALAEVGMDRLAAHEFELADHLRHTIGSLPGVTTYRIWDDDAQTLATLAFNIEGYEHGLAAQILSCEYGIGVRNGCFCAHPLVASLLNLSDEEITATQAALRAGERVHVPGSLRISAGIGTRLEHLDRAAEAMASLIAHGPQWTYVQDQDGSWRPDPDPRAWPKLPVRLAAH